MFTRTQSIQKWFRLEVLSPKKPVLIPADNIAYIVDLPEEGARIVFKNSATTVVYVDVTSTVKEIEKLMVDVT